jgi:hypothetical protein
VAERTAGPEESHARNRAIGNARAALGLAASDPVHAWPVARIKQVGPGFLLVVFGAAEAAVGIAAVDPSTGEVLEKARLPGRQPHFPIGAEEAIRRAGMDANTEATLVWDPVAVSRSPFYPLWQLRGAGRTVWVDSIRGTVWNRLDAPRGGGAGPE